MERAMMVEHQPQSCRWATPTLFLEWPYWIDAWSWSWSCMLHNRLHLLSNGERCRHCSHWTGRSLTDQPASFNPDEALLKD